MQGFFIYIGGGALPPSCRQSVDSLDSKNRNMKHVPVFAWIERAGGLPSPLHTPPMRVAARQYGFVYNLKLPLRLEGQLFCRSIACRGILAAEQAVGRRILLDRGKTSHRREETVVVFVVVALADLAQQHRPAAGLHREVVV